MLDFDWKTTALPEQSSELAWEQYHESSKTGHYDLTLSNEQVLAEMDNMYESFPYNNLEFTPLPDTLAPFKFDLKETVLRRRTSTEFIPKPLSLEQLRTLLHFGYGLTWSNKENHYISRSFRTVPSGGGLYPLELFFFANRSISELQAGLYHFSPVKNGIHLIRDGNFTDLLANCLVSFQSDLVAKLGLLFFITAAFNRSVFKYRDKGYRFTLIEAGHVAQNINLAATAMDLGVINIGGFHDRMIDAFLQLDGLNQSTLYLLGVGHKEIESDNGSD